MTTANESYNRHDRYASGRKKLAILSLMMFSVSIAQLYISMLITEGSYHLNSLKKDHKSIVVEVAILEQEIDGLSNLYVIDEKAREFGMIPSEEVAFIDLAKQSGR